MQQPLVSILIPVFNADRKVAKAILSCIKQSYTNTQIIVLDDGSTDFTKGELNKFSNIRVLRHEKNLGTSVTRNDLLKAATGKYIAWLDADDAMLPDRIERQVRFMEEHPEVDVAGSWVLTDNGLFPKKKMPTDKDVIHSYLWFKNCFIHSSIISKNFYSEENIFYDTAFKSNVEDSEIWYRLSKIKVLANIPEYLTSIRLPLSKNVNLKHIRFQYESELNKFWENKWNDVPVSIAPEKRELFQRFLYKMELLKYKQLKEVKPILNQLVTNENKLIIHSYRVRIFIRLNFLQKISNMDLLPSLLFYFAMKRRRIVR